MADIAQLGFSVDSSQVDQARVSLTALSAPATQADAAAEKLATSFDKVNSAANGVAPAASRAGAALASAAAGAGRLSVANEGVVAATAGVTAANIAGSVAVDKITSAVHGHSAAVGLNRMQQMEMMHVTRALVDSMVAGINPIRAVAMESGRLGQIFAGSGGVTTALKLMAIQFGLLKVVTPVSVLQDIASAQDVAAGATIAATAANVANAESAAAAGVANAEYEAILITAAGAMQGEALATAEAVGATTGLTVSMEAAAAAAQGNAAAIEEVTVAEQMSAIAAGEAAAANEVMAATAADAAQKEILALTPIALILAGIAGGIAAVGVAFGVAANVIGQNVGDLTKGMNLTSEQIEKIKEKHIKTTVTMGDTWNSFWTTVKESILGGKGKAISDGYNKIMKGIADVTVSAFKLVGGVVEGSLMAMIEGFKILPGAIGDIFYQTVNNAIVGINFLIAKVVEGVNALGGHLKGFQLSTVNDPFAGQAAKGVTAYFDAFHKGVDKFAKDTDSFATHWDKNAKATGKFRLRKELGHAPKDGSGKTDEEKFQDIITGGQDELALTNAKISGIDLTADAAARLAKEQEFLNKVTKEHITLLPGEKEKLIALADSIADADTKLKNLTEFKKVLTGADASLVTLKAQGDLIGLVGEQLATATHYQELYNEATANGRKIDAGQIADLHVKAAALGRQDTKNTHDKFVNDAATGAANTAADLRQEQSLIGLSADEVLRLTNEYNALADARRQHINLTPKEIADITAATDANTKLQISIRDTKEALDFASGATKGFFSDMYAGLTQGKSLWENFGDAVLNILNKLISKLIDAEIEGLFNGGKTGGGGDFLSSVISGITGLFGGGAGGGAASGVGGSLGVNAPVTFAASGAVFNNGLLTQPTVIAHHSGLTIGGEAGTEAIVPLTRGPDGNLGVQMTGGAKSGQTVLNPTFVIQASQTLTGAISSQDIADAGKRQQEQTVTQVKKSLATWIQTIQTDGAIN